MPTIQVDIVSAEGEIFSGEADMVFAPGEMGELGIAPRHTPLLTGLSPGEVRVQNEEGEHFFFVSGGILEIQPFKVTVLADTALRARDIDEAAAVESQRKAEDALRDSQDDMDFTRAQMALAEATARLKVLKNVRNTGKR